MSVNPYVEAQPMPAELRKTSWKFILYRVVLFAILARFVYYLATDFKFNLIIDNWHKFASGIWLTIQLTFLALLFGFIIALPTAMWRVKHPRGVLTKIIEFYAYIFRGSPLLVQTFLIYYGLSQFDFVKNSFLWPVLREPYWCALIAFSLNSGAYANEILRGALKDTDGGIIEAAASLGLSKRQSDWLVWVPASLRRAIPAYGNEIVFMLHGSAIASFITLTDIFGAAKEVNARYYVYNEGYFTAAALYMSITFVIIMIMRRVEHRYLSYLRR